MRTKTNSIAEPSPSEILERFFKLKQNKTDIRTEVLAGLTTFVTLAYILFVYPNILKETGMPVNAIFTATCIASAFATLIMGLYANYPIAVAPGMGLGAYFTYTVCTGMHLPWQTALGAVFISGVVFFLLTVTKGFSDFTEALPAFFTIIMMPLTYSIAQGLAFGFMSYTIIKLITGRICENNAVTYTLTVLFIIHFVLS